MTQEILINAHPYEKRIAIVEDGRLVELYSESLENQEVTGNIYKGIVRSVLPGMGAVFIDIGLKRTAFLHFSELDADFLPEQFRKICERGNSSQIDKIFTVGQEVVVQIKKPPLSKKGASLTCKLTIPGKFLVFMPFKDKVAISRKIKSGKQKHKFAEMLNRIKADDVGVIVRTDTENSTEEDFAMEYKTLDTVWTALKKGIEFAKGPTCLFNQNELIFMLTRDLFNSNVKRLVVDDRQYRQKIIDQLKTIAPDLIDRVELYEEKTPLFDVYRIENDIHRIGNSRISLKSGGNLRIERTEALVSIDVNTGSFTGDNHYDDTILQTNLEAAYEVARQVRLRDLSGIMIVDFIDMASAASRDKVLKEVRKYMRRDRAKNKVYPFSPLGLVEISRKRRRPEIIMNLSEVCPHCNGTGRLLAKDSVAVKLYRWLQRSEFFINKEKLIVRVHRNVLHFLEANTDFLGDYMKRIEILEDPELEPYEFKILMEKNGKDVTEEYKS
ncbi:MAG: Rne/Rng family ribonuclease [Candidatus Cloacimonetes bacterium]|nr:Rne/Rng family ribonuclease [Candidatus Cloacimonadota bacterium]